MKLTRVVVADFQQFKLLDIDLTDPATGKPLDRVCFIGPNGTGKSTLLRLLDELASAVTRPAKIFAEFVDDHGAGVLSSFGGSYEPLSNRTLPEVARGLSFPPQSTARELRVALGPELVPRVVFDPHPALAIHIPSDGSLLLPNDPPIATLNDAVPWMRQVPQHHVVGPAQAEAFWTVLTAIVARRRERYDAFLADPANRKRTVEDVEADFARQHPEILPRLAELWSPLLAPCGLELDLANVKLPFQLGESLSAHVRSRVTGDSVGYNALSSGLRAFLFRLGHVLALYWTLKVPGGMLFVDEPELSLHPDFLYDIIDIYGRIAVNTQMFVATHSPIVAAQFRPEERILLEFDDDGFVSSRRGSAPEGDDPNHLLARDFHVRSVLGHKGLEQWDHYLELYKRAKNEPDPEKRNDLLEEYLRIGRTYGFKAAQTENGAARTGTRP